MNGNVETRNGATPAIRRVAILGTGKMGSAIAGRLSEAGFEIVLWNRTRSRADALGIGPVAGTPAAAARNADIVVSSLTGPEAVRAAYLGPDGALAVGSGKLFVEMSTAGTDLVADLERRVAAAGGSLVDAPILGAPLVVRGGGAAILAGGSDEDVATARAVLNALGTVRHVGPLGSAARLKLVANSMLGAVIVAAAELQVAGERSGLDPDDVFWVLERLVPALAARRDGYLADRHVPQFALRDLRKDLGFALGVFAESHASTPLTDLSSALVIAAATSTPDLDISAVVRPYRSEPASPGNDTRAAQPLRAAAH